MSSTNVRYLPILGSYGLAAAVFTHVAARRESRPTSALELTEAALATFYVARVLAHEKVGSVFREPFVEPAPDADPDDPRGDAKQPTGSGLRRTAGELITCTRCLGPWAGAMLTFGAAFAPRHTRVATRVLALAGANSIVQAGHSALCEAANAAARMAGDTTPGERPATD